MTDQLSAQNHRCAPTTLASSEVVNCRSAPRRDCQRGSAVTEFVFVVPLVLLVFAAVCQVALAGYVRSTLIACAAEGAAAGAAHGSNRATAVAATKQAARDSVAGGAIKSVTAQQVVVDGVQTMQVTVRARLPLFGLLGPTALDVSAHSLQEGANW